MNIKEGFAKALRKARKAKGLSQESFGEVSSRTYVSTLERGLYSPTLDKIEDLASFIGIHPLRLIALAYLETEGQDTLNQLLDRVRKEIPSTKSD